MTQSWAPAVTGNATRARVSASVTSSVLIALYLRACTRLHAKCHSPRGRRKRHFRGAGSSLAAGCAAGGSKLRRALLSRRGSRERGARRCASRCDRDGVLRSRGTTPARRFSGYGTHRAHVRALILLPLAATLADAGPALGYSS